MAAAGGDLSYERCEQLVQYLRGTISAQHVDYAACVLRQLDWQDGLELAEARGNAPSVVAELVRWLHSRSVNVAGVRPAPLSLYHALAVGLYGEALDSAARQRHQ